MKQKNSETVPTISPVSTHPRRMKSRLLKGILIFFCSLLTVSLLLGGFGTWFVLHSLPQTSGTLSVKGLSRSVIVLRDQWGVPAITANNLHDLFLAQGYVTAQDRLFEMEMNRRIAQGRLAEMFGAGPNQSIVNADAFLRTLGLYRAAQADSAHLSPQGKQAFQAYADGVNAFIQTHSGSLPVEFSILGISPSPWTVTDSLAYGRVVALSLDDSWYYKYTRSLVLEQAGPEISNWIFPDYPSDNPTVIQSQGQPATLSSHSVRASTTVAPPSQSNAHLSADPIQSLRLLRSLLGNVNDGLGSNAWVADGTRTQSGKPLLANDPHLGIKSPSPWYEVELHTSALNLIGFSFPGVPGILIGHNDHIAWGITNVGADDADLYLEKLDAKEHPGDYYYDGHWRPLLIRKESIFVRNSTQPIRISIASTIHGPLINTVQNDLKNYPSVALKWIALQPAFDFTGAFELDFATNWSQFTTALSHISLSENFLYADVAGNIGYHMSGLLPVRSSDNYLLPVDGSTSTHEWLGYVPQNALPWLYNPPTHQIISANNQIAPPNYPVHISSQWDQGYRARRITDLLLKTPTLSVATYRQIQADDYSIPASQLTPYLIQAGQNYGGNAAKAAKILQGWNFTMDAKSKAAAVFEVTIGTLLRKLLEPRLGKQIYNIYVSNIYESSFFLFLLDAFTRPSAPFFKGNSNLQTARDTLIGQALNDALTQLSTQIGTDESQWQWGALHKATFTNILAGSIPIIFQTTSFAQNGDSVTVNFGGDGSFPADPGDYRQYVVPSMREIIDLSNFDQSLWIITGGESGQPFSGHVADLSPLWNENHYQSMEFSSRSKNLDEREKLILQPG